MYYFVSIVVGLLLALTWGCVFALLNTVTVWLAQPIITVYCILLRVLSMPWRATVRCLVDPVFQSMSQALRHVSVRCLVQSTTRPHNVQLNQLSADAPVDWLGYV